MNRIEERLNILKTEGKKAFITYMTAGLPSMEKTKDVILAQARGGTDIIELGIPFSDPVADGPVIQDASYRSIKLGTNLKKVFAAMEEVRKETEIPVVFMLYYNTVLYYGMERFVDSCIKYGVDGLIIPDLPFEEQGKIKEYLDRTDAPFLIQLVSPVSKDRIPMILEEARGFVYCVSSMGVTGQEADFHRDVMNYLAGVKRISKIPVMMGFGIRSAKDIEPMREHIDGAIVGSHFIRTMEEKGYDIKAIEQYCRVFKNELG